MSKTDLMLAYLRAGLPLPSSCCKGEACLPRSNYKGEASSPKWYRWVGAECGLRKTEKIFSANNEQRTIKRG